MLLDCGNGVFAKLRPTHDYRSVDAVVVSHLHAARRRGSCHGVRRGRPHHGGSAALWFCEGPHFVTTHAGAGAARLVLTHFSDELDAERVPAAAAAYGGEAELAREGAVCEALTAPVSPFGAGERGWCADASARPAAAAANTIDRHVAP